MAEIDTVIAFPSRQSNTMPCGGGPKNAYGLTAMEEAYARALSDGMTRSDAFRIANPKAAEMKPEVVWQRAYAMGKRPLVKARVEALLRQKETAALHDAVRARAFIVERLWAEANDMKSRASDRLRAIELMGKLEWVGAFRERAELQVSDLRTPEQITRRIEELLRLAKPT